MRLCTDIGGRYYVEMGRYRTWVVSHWQWGTTCAAYGLPNVHQSREVFDALKTRGRPDAS